MEKAGGSLAFAKAECTYKAPLYRRIFVVGRRAADEVLEAHCCLLVEGCNDVVVLSFIC